MAVTYNKTLEELQDEIGKIFDSLLEEIIGISPMQEEKPDNSHQI